MKGNLIISNKEKSSADIDLTIVKAKMGVDTSKMKKLFKADMLKVRILHQKGMTNHEIASSLYQDKRRSKKISSSAEAHMEYVDVIVRYLGLKENAVQGKDQSSFNLGKYREI